MFRIKESLTLRILATGLLACLVVCMPSCNSTPIQSDDILDNGTSDVASSVQTNPPVNSSELDKPTIPEDVAAGTEYLYDFKFAEKYDEQVTSDFSFTFPSGRLEDIKNDTVFLLERYKLENTPVQENTYHSDGMQPHQLKDYCFDFNEIGSLYLKTDFYAPDSLEYVSFVWTDINGTKTNLGVGVGSSEKELLTAYTDNLYYLDKGNLEPIYCSLEDTPDYEFEYAYTWQPFTAETNEIRDITFYIKDGIVAAIEMVEPFELRYVYGFDCEAALQKANENRANGI